jgi:hypothetical protein
MLATSYIQVNAKENAFKILESKEREEEDNIFNVLVNTQI